MKTWAKFFLGVFLPCLTPLLFYGQGDSKNEIIEQRLELIGEDLEREDIDFTVLIDDLSYYLDSPLNLNHANQEDLERLHLLNRIQINALIQHISENGKLIHLTELQTIEHFDHQTIRNILPFVSISGDLDQLHISWKEMLKNGKNDLFLRYHRVLEQQEGYAAIDEEELANNPNRRYLGNPDRYYLRYRFQYQNKISWGITAEKDPGEEFFRGSQKQGFDFYSAHFFIRDYGKLKALAIGDYHAEFGQGLTLWSGLAFGKNAEVMSLKRTSFGLRPYTASDENRFMRGIAATYEVYKNVELTLFASHKPIDGNISRVDSLGGVNEITISSFQQTGFHRTPNELRNRNAITETHLGGHLAYKTRKLNLGATILKTEYGGNVERNLRIYNQFEFNQNQNAVLGIDYSYLFKNINYFGEFSASENGGRAFLNGALIALDKRLSLVVMQRNYSRDFHAPLSNAIAEGSRNINENGIYMGFHLNPAKHWLITAYVDQFRFPWMRYQTDKPNTTGYDLFAQASYRPNKKTEMYWRYRNRQRPRNTGIDINSIRYVTDIHQANYRFQLTYRVNPEITLRSRLEYVTFEREGFANEQGYLMFQDIRYQPKEKAYSLTFRYALFDTDGFNSRIYTYENDVLYSFSIPAFFDRGARVYGILRYKAARNLDIWFRIAQTVYSNRTTIGSGLETIHGNTRTEVKAQARWRF
jgi:hypothetical protein